MSRGIVQFNRTSNCIAACLMVLHDYSWLESILSDSAIRTHWLWSELVLSLEGQIKVRIINLTYIYYFHHTFEQRLVGILNLTHSHFLSFAHRVWSTVFQVLAFSRFVAFMMLWIECWLMCLCLLLTEHLVSSSKTSRDTDITTWVVVED